METTNNKSIKEDIIIVLKESIKFALISSAIFLVVGTSMAYILLYIIGMRDVETAGLLIGVVVAIVIVIVDHKKTHIHDKILECNRRIARKILKIQ